MASGTVVVLPSSDAALTSGFRRFQALGLDVRLLEDSAGPNATEAARLCAQLNEDPPGSPMIIVAVGRSARLLPAIALAQRSAHRAVRDYLLIEPDVPPVSDGWPDAHVTVFSDLDHTQARLRGWTIEPRSAFDRWAPPDE